MLVYIHIIVLIYVALCLDGFTLRKNLDNHAGYRHIILSMSTRSSNSKTTENDPSTTTPLVAVGGATVLKCEKLSKAYTGVNQLNEVSFQLGKGQRVGLIGVNGAGKSTFMKCLAKMIQPDSGTIESLSNLNIIFVEQDSKWENELVYEALYGNDSPQSIASKKYMAAMNPAVLNNPNADDRLLVEAVELIEESNAWEFQEEGISIASKLNIGQNELYRPMNSLSGGQKKRACLAAALLKKPDVLLLDEPTNHIDIDALEWLSDYLRPGGMRENKDMAVLLVTHDRYFLEKVCNEILELDRGSMYRYSCNYSKYLDLKAARLAAEDAETERAKTRLRRESEWMAKQPRARQAKSRVREAGYYELVERAKNKNPDVKAIELATPEEKAKQKRLGGIIAQFRGAKYILKPSTHNPTDNNNNNNNEELYEEDGISNMDSNQSKVLLNDFTYDFRQRDRIGIVGPNGVGKSTFLKILTGQLTLDTGFVRIGDTVKIGYYDQSGLKLTTEQERMPVLKFVQEECEKSSVQDKSGSVVSGDSQPKIAISVEDPSTMGRRKKLAGKEG